MTDRILTDELVELYIEGHKVGAWRRRAEELDGWTTEELLDELFLRWPNAKGIRLPLAGLNSRDRTEVLDPALTSGALDHPGITRERLGLPRVICYRLDLPPSIFGGNTAFIDRLKAGGYR